MGAQIPMRRGLVQLLLLALLPHSGALHVWSDAVGITRACKIGHTSNGRGLVATRKLAAGETVLHVPRKLTLGVNREAGPGQPGWLTRLSLRLAEEIHAGEDGTHHDFVQSLPPPPDGPHCWSSAQLAELQNATLAAEAKKRADELAAEWEKVSASTAVPRQHFENAYGLAASRVIGARGESGRRGERLLLVPLLDMANHGHGVGGHLEFDRESGDVSLIAGSDLAEGDEILLDYGDRPTDEFLLQYGFVPERNPSDTTAVPLPCGAREVVSWDDARGATPQVREACEAMLGGLPTSLAEDAAALAALRSSGTALGSAEATALRFRLAKKQLLAAVAGRPASSAAASAFAR